MIGKTCENQRTKMIIQIQKNSKINIQIIHLKNQMKENNIN